MGAVSTSSTTEGRRGLDRLDHRACVVSTGSTTERRRGLDRLDHRGRSGLDKLDHRASRVISTSSTTEAGSTWWSTGSTTEGRSTWSQTGSTTQGCGSRASGRMGGTEGNDIDSEIPLDADPTDVAGQQEELLPPANDEEAPEPEPDELPNEANEADVAEQRTKVSGHRRRRAGRALTSGRARGVGSARALAQRGAPCPAHGERGAGDDNGRL